MFKSARLSLRPCLGALFLLIASCSQDFTVSINDQAVFDPGGRLFVGQIADADLQGCVNLAIQQQELQNPETLAVLSCANSQIRDLSNISRLAQLRFLDLGDNNISNITPLEELSQLGGLNLMNNRISDISALLNMPTLVSVNLRGNDELPCEQLLLLQARLGDNLESPANCRN